jgi:predicted RNA-binding Zn-ribbon protein involved in translation (DUF1610 family)
MEQNDHYPDGNTVRRAAVVLWMALKCPRCGGQHIDKDEWAKRLHRTHKCEHCGVQWRPEEVQDHQPVYTFGVEP